MILLLVHSTVSFFEIPLRPTIITHTRDSCAIQAILETTIQKYFCIPTSNEYKWIFKQSKLLAIKERIFCRLFLKCTKCTIRIVISGACYRWSSWVQSDYSLQCKKIAWDHSTLEMTSQSNQINITEAGLSKPIFCPYTCDKFTRGKYWMWEAWLEPWKLGWTRRFSP